ncbi:hypothetical protein GCM10007860_12400 [Chitiniphilus shinanonensis]|uniref:SPW repeat-containing protein n=1 Tax=Chitiniphilus shinanonensis TaxID=553088 RepID=A0ABQ6BR09_9NEIS|nr:hypothetical protein [Chitiniphilus shinanonensis]GLS04094.1 hypothetical protein GCM10007860_12400 [Chitiniphilus shinanonensis]
MRNTLLPIALIVIGAGWLVNSLNVAPAVSWIVVFGLVCAGIGVLLVEGCNKRTVVTGPLLILGGGGVFANQQYQWGWSVLLPLLMMAWGLLLLVARLDAVPDAPGPEPLRLPGQDGDTA